MVPCILLRIFASYSTVKKYLNKYTINYNNHTFFLEIVTMEIIHMQ